MINPLLFSEIASQKSHHRKNRKENCVQGCHKRQAQGARGESCTAEEKHGGKAAERKRRAGQV